MKDLSPYFSTFLRSQLTNYYIIIKPLVDVSAMSTQYLPSFLHDHNTFNSACKSKICLLN